MKRLLSALLAFVLLFCLCGCNALEGVLDRFAADDDGSQVQKSTSQQAVPEENHHKKDPNYTPVVGEDPVPETFDDEDSVVTPPQQQQEEEQEEEQEEQQEQEDEQQNNEQQPEEDNTTEPDESKKPDSIKVTATQIQQIADKFLVLVNEERARVGLNPITPNTTLNGYAQIRAKEIQTKFSHDRPDNSEWSSIINRDEYPYTTAGENIVMTSHMGDQPYNPNLHYWTGSEEQIEAAAGWIYKLFRGSPSHYANMINESFEESGIGITYIMDSTGSIPVFYLAHLFGAQ